MTIADRALGDAPKRIRRSAWGRGGRRREFVEALGPARSEDGLRRSSGRARPPTPPPALARELGIPLATLEEVGELDVTFDGADEVAPNLDLIKGYGGALVREKIVAASSKRLVDPGRPRQGGLPPRRAWQAPRRGRPVRRPAGPAEARRPGPPADHPACQRRERLPLRQRQHHPRLPRRPDRRPRRPGAGDPRHPRRRRYRPVLGMAETVLIQAKDGSVTVHQRGG